MAVYRRGYQRYSGPLTSHGARLLVLPRFAWERIFHQRLVTVILIVSFFWPLLCALFIYLANHAELWAGFSPGFKKILSVNGQFFTVFMGAQSGFALILAAIAGPGLVAPDLTNNALPLYFSRPLTRADYILSRMIVLLGMLALVTVVPGLLLFAMQSGMAGWDWIFANLHLGAGMVAGFCLDLILISLVALTSSAYVKWRVVAGALVLAFFFLMAGAAEMVNAVFRVDWASVFNPAYAMSTVWAAMLGVDMPETAPGPVESGIYLVGLSLFLLWLLSRKLRAVEVVR